ncbi:MAG: hypothetical protein IT376_01930 [Polyangiaceae bacterium]|nr:hypothetical protein [Polyangiaceae bacterium]
MTTIPSASRCRRRGWGALAALWLSGVAIPQASAQEPPPPAPPGSAPAPGPAAPAPPPPPPQYPPGAQAPPPPYPPQQYPPQPYPPQQYPPQQYPPQQYPPQQYPPAYTEPPPPRLRERRGIREHDGFYLRVGLGAATHAFTLKTERTKAFGQKWTARGGGAAMEFAMGGTVGSGFVIGGGIYGTSTGRPSYEVETGGASVQRDGSDFVVSGVGPFVDWYFDAKAGGHVQLALTVGGLSLAGLPAGIVDSADPEVEPDEAVQGSGWSVVLGGGYEFWIGEQWSLGPLLRFQYSEGSLVETSDLEEIDPIDVAGYSVSLLATVSFH